MLLFIHLTSYSFSACDSLELITDSNNTKLIMYDGSEDIIYDMPSGYTEDVLVCNPDTSAYVRLGRDKSIEDALLDVYDQIPCDGLQIQCNIPVQEIDGQCDWEFFDLNAIALDRNFIDIFSCYDPIIIDSLIGRRCTNDQGESCPQSPTLAPTQAPTDVPTAPSSSPSAAPTQPPSTAPTNAPSLSPSIAPTFSPTESPTDLPTEAPTTSPINHPTFSPSLAPSLAPSLSPTNNPIASKDFDSYILITYLLQNVNEEDKIKIVSDPINETTAIQDIIKQHYFLKGFLDFQNFLVIILDIEDTEIADIDTNTQFEWTNLDTLALNARIECSQDDDNIDYCASIKQQSQKKNDFYARAAVDLQAHFENSQLGFSSENGNNVNVQCKDCDEEPPDYVLYALGTIVGIIYLIALFALLFNIGKFPKCPGFNYVDNGNWVALMTIGLQFWYVFKSFLQKCID